MKFFLFIGCKIILFEKYINMLCYNLICLKVVVFIGYFDEYVFLVYGGWVDNEKIG